ncbi:MAG TPA: DUF3048 domain-containing protein [Jiangellaceae bacterium]|nr:DUF3048 domain-containing protein [Jiangellaceae bacterium]
MIDEGGWWVRAAMGVVLVGVLLAISVACNDEPDAGPAPTPAPPTPTTPDPTTPEPTTPTPATPTATPEPTPEPVWPLTGLPAPDGVPDDPVLVVKVDNTGPARPQVGLSAADLVVHELVEGGATRLAAMYHSTLPPEVMPVRSVRTSDIALVAPTGGALVASGGAQRVLEQLADAGITVIAEGSAGFSRDQARGAPYNVSVDLGATIDEAAGLGAPEQPYLEWADPDAELGAGEAVESVAVRFSTTHTTTWSWDGSGWQQADDLAAEGDEFAPETVLVLLVEIVDAGYTDPAGNFVPESVLEGTGDAFLLTDGEVIEAEWAKDDPAAAIELADSAGDPLPVPPGRTWIELVPEAGEVTWTAP